MAPCTKPTTEHHTLKLRISNCLFQRPNESRFTRERWAGATDARGAAALQPA